MTDWKEMKLSDCLTVKHGRSQKEVELVEGQYPILGTGGEIGRTNSYLFNKPSVLIGRKGTIDKPRYMDTPFWTVDTLFYTHIKENAVAKFIYYVFLTINWYRYNEASGVPSLSASTVSSIKVVLPSTAEQKRIVTVIETWDKYLDKLDKKIELKKTVQRGLMQQLLTGKRRLPGFNNKWSTTKLGEVSSITKGKALTSNGLLAGEIPVIAGGKTSPYNHNSHTHEDVITVSASGAYAGYVSYHPYKIWASDCSVICGISGLTATDYIYHYLKYKQKNIYLLQSGGAQPHIYPADLKMMKIALPPIEEQLAIAVILTASDNELVAMIKYKKLLASQKQFLLASLVDGKIRTPENLKMPTKEVQHA